MQRRWNLSRATRLRIRHVRGGKFLRQASGFLRYESCKLPQVLCIWQSAASRVGRIAPDAFSLLFYARSLVWHADDLFYSVRRDGSRDPRGTLYGFFDYFLWYMRMILCDARATSFICRIRVQRILLRNVILYDDEVWYFEKFLVLQMMAKVSIKAINAMRESSVHKIRTSVFIFCNFLSTHIPMTASRMGLFIWLVCYLQMSHDLYRWYTAFTYFYAATQNCSNVF